jgi:hypothetical protein
MRKMTWVTFVALVAVAVCIAMPMERTTKPLPVSIHPNWASRHNALVTSYKTNRIAVAAEQKESGLIELSFREGITTNETKVHLSLSISNVVHNLRIEPDLKLNVDWNSWTFEINPDHLDKTTLTLGSVDGGTIMRREFKLTTNANKFQEDTDASAPDPQK